MVQSQQQLFQSLLHTKWFTEASTRKRLSLFTQNFSQQERKRRKFQRKRNQRQNQQLSLNYFLCFLTLNVPLRYSIIGGIIDKNIIASITNEKLSLTN